MKRKLQFLIFFLLFGSIHLFGQMTYFVDKNTLNESDAGPLGLSWYNAYTSLQSALDIAVSGDQIWVAKGTYYPTTEIGGTDTRYQAFAMIDGVKIYGGFAGTETAISERTNYGLGETNETILSGDLNDDDLITGSGATLVISNKTENCYHIFRHESGVVLSSSTLLDGFTLTGGNASGIDGSGDDDGGAITNLGTGQSPTINQCVFIYNTAKDEGGAISNITNCDMQITNSSFIKNVAAPKNEANDGTGGAINNYQANPTIVNCLFQGNQAGNDANDLGGAIYNMESSPNIINCTFVDNSAYYGGAVYNHTNSTALTNCIFWDNGAVGGVGSQIRNYNSNPTFTNCNIQGGWNGSGVGNNISTPVDGGGNINADPQFVGGALNSAHPYAINGISLCADAGSDAANTEDYDIRGNGFSRKLSKTDGSVGTIDIGAYEYNTNNDFDYSPIFVDLNASGNNDGTNWTNAFTSLQSAIEAAQEGDYIWVAKGTYKPTKEIDGTTDSPRDFTFYLNKSISINGGFAGTETDISQRVDFGNGESNETILSGDIQVEGTHTDNCYTIVYLEADGDYNVELNGLSIRNGYADGNESAAQNSGAGICYLGGSVSVSGSLLVENCYFENNYSTQHGSVINVWTSSTSTSFSYDVELNNSIIENNSPVNSFFSTIYSRADGSTILNFNIKNSQIINNVATSLYGYTFNNGQLNLNVYNTLIANNTFGIQNSCSGTYTGKFVNVTVVNNNSSSVNGIYGGIRDSHTTGDLETEYINCIIYDNNSKWGSNSLSSNFYSNNGLNSSFKNSILGSSNGSGATWSAMGASDGGNNIDANPLFVGTVLNPSHPYSISGSSPAIDAGDNASILEDYDVRGEGFARKLSKTDGSAGTVDMGAYEYKYGIDPDKSVIYVDVNVSTGDNNGTSWANAYSNFTDALTNSADRQEIWVAKGTYKPSKEKIGTTNTPRQFTFFLNKNIKIYGGFAGTETGISQRANYGNGETNETILSGDIGTEHIYTDNCYNVVYVDADAGNEIEINGFSIKNGYADGTSDPYNSGAGIYYDAVAEMNSGGFDLKNCYFTDNYSKSSGAALILHAASTSSDTYEYSVSIDNCIFEDNSANSGFASVFAYVKNNSILNLNFNNSQIVKNISIGFSANASFSGILNIEAKNLLITNNTLGIYNYCYDGSILRANYTNTTVANNVTPLSVHYSGINEYFYNGTAMDIDYINCVVYGNTTNYGSGLLNSNYYTYNAPTTTFKNSLLGGSGGSGGSWSANGATDGGNNIDADPLFVGSDLNASHPYSIYQNSPCTDAGDNTAIEEAFDIRGEGYARKLSKTDGSSGTVDIGAYEYLHGTDPEGPALTTTWTGATDTDYTNPANWSNGAPANSLNVIIPNGSNVEFTGAVESNSLEVEAGGKLTVSQAGTLTSSGNVTIKSDASSSGSLIISGSYSGPDIIYQRYMLANQWHMFGSPLSGQSINSFLTDTDNAILMDGDNYKMKHYIEGPTESWSADYTASTTGNIELGNAYVVKRSTDGTVSLIGQPNNATVNITINRNDYGWNLLGNPFTSAIAATNGTANGINNLISVNEAVLDPSYASVYVWEENTADPTNVNNYRLINHADSDLAQEYLQVGQGFFVRSKAGGETFTMTPEMQSHQTTIPFKTSNNDWVSITLNASISNAKASTRILYRNDMNLGLDIGYDAGLLNSYPDFALYTRLVEDNGVNFALQCLPTDFDNLIIPIGLDAKAGEIVSFSADISNLNEEYAVILEDKSNYTFTNLSDGGECNILLTDDNEGTGRFYIHTNFKSALGFDDLASENTFQVFSLSRVNQIVIRGDVIANTSAKIFSITGKLMGEISLKQSKENRISFNKESGIYVIQITNAKGTFIHKFSWLKNN